ncbi:hypothetical protein HAX54_051448 [Datura stramonium]|uniref:Uncharacterized protein n=1 Tax=Datura stramonium TaxID=4076 RepID=A0ABS8WQB5_DATST|nr:hypothetical protein [Datura stramonium]
MAEAVPGLGFLDTQEQGSFFPNFGQGRAPLLQLYPLHASTCRLDQPVRQKHFGRLSCEVFTPEFKWCGRLASVRIPVAASGWPASKRSPNQQFPPFSDDSLA